MGEEVIQGGSQLRYHFHTRPTPSQESTRACCYHFGKQLTQMCLRYLLISVPVNTYPLELTTANCNCPFNCRASESRALLFPSSQDLLGAWDVEGTQCYHPTTTIHTSSTATSAFPILLGVSLPNLHFKCHP